jgi:hypothetical protein
MESKGWRWVDRGIMGHWWEGCKGAYSALVWALKQFKD